ncbi:hypothetical protein LT493_21880 [Streptomyces tricolor]|nr:hypothetical protein [Streptomyces tricolor]
MAHLFVRGTRVDWAAVLPKGATEAHAGVADVRLRAPSLLVADGPCDGRGRARPEHGEPPAAGRGGATLPQSDGLVFTSRLSLRTHSWLADHVVGEGWSCPAPRWSNWPYGPVTRSAAVSWRSC